MKETGIAVSNLKHLLLDHYGPHGGLTTEYQLTHV